VDFAKPTGANEFYGFSLNIEAKNFQTTIHMKFFENYGKHCEVSFVDFKQTIEFAY